MKSNQAEFGTSQQHQGMLCFDKEQRRETPIYTYMYIYMYIYSTLNSFMPMTNIYLVKLENHSLSNFFTLNLLTRLVLSRPSVISSSLQPSLVSLAVHSVLLSMFRLPTTCQEKVTTSECRIIIRFYIDNKRYCVNNLNKCIVFILSPIKYLYPNYSSFHLLLHRFYFSFKKIPFRAKEFVFSGKKTETQ